MKSKDEQLKLAKEALKKTHQSCLKDLHSASIDGWETVGKILDIVGETLLTLSQLEEKEEVEVTCGPCPDNLPGCLVCHSMKIEVKQPAKQEEKKFKVGCKFCGQELKSGHINTVQEHMKNCKAKKQLEEKEEVKLKKVMFCERCGLEKVFVDEPAKQEDGAEKAVSRKKVANEIVNRFMRKGARIDIKDYEYVLNKLDTMSAKAALTEEE